MKNYLELANHIKANRNQIRENGEQPFKDDSYDFNYHLSPDEVKVAAANALAEKLGCTAESAFGDYYISDIQDSVDELAPEMLNDFYGTNINEALAAIEVSRAEGNLKPAFLYVSDGSHFVTVALLPDYENTQKVTVAYINPMPEEMPEYKEHRLSKTGKAFAQSLVACLNQWYEITSEYTDLSKDQQYGNCCGLSVAANVSTIAKHYADNKPISELESSIFCAKSPEEKVNLYGKMANTLFKAEKRVEEFKSSVSNEPDLETGEAFPKEADISSIAEEVKKKAPYSHSALRDLTTCLATIAIPAACFLALGAYSSTAEISLLEATAIGLAAHALPLCFAAIAVGLLAATLSIAFNYDNAVFKQPTYVEALDNSKQENHVLSIYS